MQFVDSLAGGYTKARACECSVLHLVVSQIVRCRDTDYTSTSVLDNDVNQAELGIDRSLVEKIDQAVPGRASQADNV